MSIRPIDMCSPHRSQFCCFFVLDFGSDNYFVMLRAIFRSSSFFLTSYCSSKYISYAALALCRRSASTWLVSGSFLAKNRTHNSINTLEFVTYLTTNNTQQQKSTFSKYYNGYSIISQVQIIFNHLICEMGPDDNPVQ